MGHSSFIPLFRNSSAINACFTADPNNLSIAHFGVLEIEKHIYLWFYRRYNLTERTKREKTIHMDMIFIDTCSNETQERAG